MSDQITSSDELRNFLSDKQSRRKIDTTALLDLHGRAAAEIDSLNQRVAGLQQRLANAETARPQAPAAPAPTADNTSDSAVLILRNAQIAADETLAEAARMQTRAAATLNEAEGHARAKAAEALEQAGVTAGEIIDAAELQAADILTANQKTIDRAEFLHRQYIEKASSVRREAEALVEFSRQVESLAEAEVELPEAPAAHASPDAAPVDAVVEATPLEIVDDEPVTLPVEAPQPVAEITAPPPPPPPAPVQAQATAPPPPPVPSVTDLLDLTESDLEETLDTASIEDELFDDELIDLREPAADPSSGLQFFGRD